MESCRDHFMKVIGFAKMAGRLPQFMRELKYLCHYADRNERFDTMCRLGKDFAPMSFNFAILQRPKTRHLMRYLSRPEYLKMFRFQRDYGKIPYHWKRDLLKDLEDTDLSTKKGRKYAKRRYKNDRKYRYSESAIWFNTDIKQRLKYRKEITEEAGEKWFFWFNGGLIFHGDHDGGGDGGMPTLSVCLQPTDGWAIHT